MKKRQEMIYDFMLALAPTTFEQIQMMDDYAKEEGIPPISNDMVFGDMYDTACGLADQYLRGL